MALAGVETAKYEELCRLCATKSTMVLAIHIFENEGAIRQINNKIHNCLPIKVSETDYLPKMICENCLYKLELFYDFRESTIQTEKLLIELYKEIISNISNVHLGNDLHQAPCMMPLDNSDLMMVEHQPLVDYQNLDNVSNITLPSMDHCNDIIVQNKISLNQENLNLKSFSDIEVNSNTLDLQDQSNSNFPHQESSLLASSDTQESHIHDEDLLIQDHQSFADHFDFQLNIQERSLRTMPSIQNIVDMVQNTSHQKTMPPLKKIENANMKFEGSNLNDINLNVLRLSNMYTNTEHCDMETLKQEDSNSGSSSLQIVSQTNSILQQMNGGSNQNSLQEKNKLKHEETDTFTSHINGISKEQPSSKQALGSQGTEDSLLVISHTEDWFYCDICGTSSTNKSEFEVHYDSHFYKCKTCLIVFTTTQSLEDHVREVHFNNDSSSQATEMQEIVPEVTQNEAETEPIENDGENDSSTNDSKQKNSSKECKECGKVYKTNYKLLQHMRKHTGEKPFKCNSCEKTFRSKIGLVQHEAKHTGQYEFSCPTCGKGFQCKSYLTVHQRVHSSVKPFPCSTCGQNFKTKQSLLDHTNRHLGVKPFICNVCGRGFITKGVCRAHQKTHTGSDNRKFLCKVCNKMFVSKSYLRTHLRIHTGEKPFVCEVCGKRFLTKVDLKVHSTLHTGEKSYTCDICGKAFARNDALRCHRRSHTGERPYSCDICGQTFTQFTPMAIHKRLHTGERPYVCEVCGKTFVSKSTMMSHAKKHML